MEYESLAADDLQTNVPFWFAHRPKPLLDFVVKNPMFAEDLDFQSWVKFQKLKLSAAIIAFIDDFGAAIENINPLEFNKNLV